MMRRTDAIRCGGGRRWRWRVICAALGLFVGWRLFTLAVFWQASTTLTKRGLPTTLDELDTWYSPQAARTNEAAALEAALNQLSHPKEWPDLIDILNQRCAEASSIVQENADGLARLTDISDAMPCRYSADLSLGFDAELSHLEPIFNACRLARVQALDHFAKGNRRDSLDALGLIVSLARSLEHEPLLVSHLVQCACARTYVGAIRAILQHGVLSAPDRDAILRQIDQVESSLQPSRAYAGECVLVLHSMRQAHTDHLDTSIIAHPCSFGAVHHLYALSGLRDLDLASLLRLYGETVVATSKEYFQARDLLRRIRSRARTQPAIHVLARRSHITRIFSGLAKSADVRAKLRCTRAAVLALAFAELNGRPPESLTELQQSSPESVLMDPFVESPLILKSDDCAVSIRSVGFELNNSTDDIVVTVPIQGVKTDNTGVKANDAGVGPKETYAL